MDHDRLPCHPGDPRCVREGGQGIRRGKGLRRYEEQRHARSLRTQSIQEARGHSRRSRIGVRFQDSRVCVRRLVYRGDGETAGKAGGRRILWGAGAVLQEPLRPVLKIHATEEKRGMDRSVRPTVCYGPLHRGECVAVHVFCPARYRRLDRVDGREEGVCTETRLSL